MFTTIQHTITPGRVIQYQLEKSGTTLTFRQVIQAWQQDPAFRLFFNQLLADAPFSAFFWEVAPVTEDQLDQPFEFVIVDAPALAAVRADRRPFASFFNSATEPVVHFDNLGGDAHLVVPCPLKADVDYPHLATFVRTAPENQIHAFWTIVGRAYEKRISTETRWLSTSGLGVYWVHVRIDEWPKYYTYRPYRG